jgi:hypothetical protein
MDFRRIGLFGALRDKGITKRRKLHGKKVFK